MYQSQQLDNGMCISCQNSKKERRSGLTYIERKQSVENKTIK